MNKLLLGLTLAFLASSGVDASLTTGCHNSQNVIANTVKLEAMHYEGVWFEQARSKDFFFDNGCFCTAANYTLNDDGTILVDNSCNKGAATGPVTNAIGRATVPDETHPGFLLVSFGLPFVKGPYAVVDVDYSQYAIVVSCPRFFGNGLVWILTREQNPAPMLVDELMNRTASMGFARADLTRTYQGEDCTNVRDSRYLETDAWEDYYM
jgi:apolipoprotein D and lipocalin family protein